MTIDEAIKEIQADIDDRNVEWNSPLGRAYKLAFEALKRIYLQREHPKRKLPTLLSGETK